VDSIDSFSRPPCVVSGSPAEAHTKTTRDDGMNLLGGENFPAFVNAWCLSAQDQPDGCSATASLCAPYCGLRLIEVWGAALQHVLRAVQGEQPSRFLLPVSESGGVTWLAVCHSPESG